MYLGPVFHHQHVLTLPASVAQLGDRSWCVLQQTSLESGIDPRARHDLRSITGTNFVLHGIDQRVERGPVHQTFFHQERLERLDAQREVRRDRLVRVRLVSTLAHRMLPAPSAIFSLALSVVMVSVFA